MTLRHLYIFIAVYQEMSITKAAERLHLAQPRVSQAVKELEEEYGVRLFERLNRKLFVTEKGERLYDYAVHLLELSQEMEEDLLSSGNGGRIRLGSSITAGAFLVPERAARFQEHYPECRLEVSVQNSGKVIRQVLKNELDLGVIEDRAEEEMLVKIPFREDRLYFLCGASHPLAEKEQVSLEEICSFPLFLREKGSASREITENYLKNCQLSCQPLWESVSNEALIQAIQKNPGITVLSGMLVEKEMAEGKIKNLPGCVLSTVFSDLSQKKISDGIHEKPDSVVYRKEMFAGKLTASLHKKHYRCSWAAISRIVSPQASKNIL